MIPLKIQLKNFLSYGSKLQTIDFGPYPFICLSGKNGHGKSALLDAITWALWGQARKTTGLTKPDAQLLRIGQTAMMVLFDFSFNGTTYRIKREFALTRGGNPYSQLEFGIYNPTDETVQSLTDKTIRGTQKKIEALIGLDFDSFVNSAFLRQGNANEFSKKSPKERKEIIASILQLDKYDVLKKNAQEKAKHLNEEIAHCKKVCEGLSEQLSEEHALLEQKKRLEDKLQDYTTQQKQVEKKINELEHEKNILHKQQEACSLVSYKLKQVTTEQKNLEKEVEQTFFIWRTINKKLQKKQNIENIKAKKVELTQMLAQLHESQQQYLSLKEELLKTKGLIQEEVKKITEEHHALIQRKQITLERLESEHNNLKNRKAEIELQREKNLKEVDYYVHEEGKCKKTLQALLPKEKFIKLQEHFEKKKSYYHLWTARVHMLQQEQASLQQKIAMTEDTSNPSCPLCEQNLSASRKKFLHQKFNKSTESLAHKIKRLSTILKSLKTILLQEHEKLQQHTQEQEQVQVLQNKINDYATTKTKLNTLLQEQQVTLASIDKQMNNIFGTMKKERTEIKKLQESSTELINNDAHYRKLTQEETRLQAELKKLSIDPQRYGILSQQLSDLEKQEQEHYELSEEQSLQKKRREEILILIKKLRTLKNNKAVIEKELQTYNHIEKQQETLKCKQIDIQKQLDALAKQKEETLKEHAQCAYKQTLLQKAKQTLKKHQQEITNLTTHYHDYQALSHAFSKDGIQALLIEEALPEIEQEANMLLAKLTYNQAQIIIESLRDLKKGGSKETLEIKISDSLGIRPYELFSGGEAFRIDFALRIAISKLLARRAGTSLQTLIIDEGFGSQDEEGLALLMDALYKIQHDFSKIIIVSHLPAMKDQFPVHFMVNKSPQGSTITVVEH